jgi:hypothetical protein
MSSVALDGGPAAAAVAAAFKPAAMSRLLAEVVDNTVQVSELSETPLVDPEFSSAVVPSLTPTLTATVVAQLPHVAADFEVRRDPGYAGEPAFTTWSATSGEVASGSPVSVRVAAGAISGSS